MKHDSKSQAQELRNEVKRKVKTIKRKFRRIQRANILYAPAQTLMCEKDRER